ncbi:MAG: aminotransferase class V-fold PLP-dependent enzyme [Vulcanimicrobiaceae bacterium]
MQETPIAREALALGPDVVYLNHAAAGVLPRRTRDTLIGLIEGQTRAGVLGFAGVERELAAYRARVGAFIGVGGDQIAFLRNTSDGANVVARGLSWDAGDEIVLPRNEFGANALPWLALRELGVVIRWIDAPRERMTPEVLARALGPRTRLVALSWVSFADGYRHDLAPLAELAHRAGAWFCVDAIQGLGAFPLDAAALGIDALYAGGAKWLLGVPGVSLLYVAPALQERLAVRWRGWRDVADIWDFLAYEQPLAPSAARFEGGTPNFLGIAALDSSLGVLAEAGLERIATHVLSLTDDLVAGLNARGARVHGERGGSRSSGIVTFEVPGCDSLALGKELGRRGIVVTFRSSGLRISPHGYNRRDEIETLLAALDQLPAAARI